MRPLIRWGLPIALGLLGIVIPQLHGQQLLQEVQAGSSLRIVDGDTIAIGERKIRLACIDAPESDQPGGAAATEHLAELLGGQVPEITTITTDRYGREISLIHGGWTQLAQVQAGTVWVYEKYLSSCPGIADQLQLAQMKAQGSGKGIWSDPQAMAPWDWRQLH